MLRHRMPTCALNGALRMPDTAENLDHPYAAWCQKRHALRETQRDPDTPAVSAKNVAIWSIRQGVVGTYRKRFNRKGSKAAK